MKLLSYIATVILVNQVQSIFSDDECSENEYRDPSTRECLPCAKKCLRCMRYPDQCTKCDPRY